jgi:hypothetical protein
LTTNTTTTNILSLKTILKEVIFKNLLHLTGSIQEILIANQFNSLSSRPPYKNANIKIYKTVIICVVRYGYEIWPLAP